MLPSSTLTDLRTSADLDSAIAASSEQAVVLFKHSLTCGTSAMAEEEVLDLAERLGPRVDVRRLVVQRSRDLSWEIERRFNVRHESPQALLLRHGAVVWQASHFGLTARALERAIDAHAR